MKQVDFVELVEELNENIPDKCYEEGIYYSYMTNGFVDIISIGDYQLFNSEMDSDDDIELYGDLKTYVLHKLSVYKMLINLL